jgi:hypothetical protein
VPRRPDAVRAIEYGGRFGPLRALNGVCI